MIYLEKKVLHDSSGQLEFPFSQQPPHDEVTVPAIHLVEHSTRHDIGVLQVEESVLTDFANFDPSQFFNHYRQVLHPN